MLPMQKKKPFIKIKNMLPKQKKKPLMDAEELKRISSTSQDDHIPEEKKHSDSNIVLNFLSTKDVPTWFRGVSRFQIVAADALFNALRDDAEQRTTHRVRNCLNSMGITPMICNKDIIQLIHLSRGNDLAFLWFLMELHYKTPDHSEYSINEQIILSIITHLDMVTTLRGLDRVLPPRQHTKKEIARLKRLEELKLAETRRQKKPKPEYVLPYFEKLVRPKPYGKKLAIEMPDFQVKFSNYSIYKNPNLIITNESNRWFATYKMQTSRRIINKILNEEVSRLFDDFNIVAEECEKTHSLCERHKVVKELENNLENELKVIARDRCLKYFDTEGKHKEEVRQRILDQLDQEIAQYMCKFRKLADRFNHETKRKNSTGKEDCFDCDDMIGDGIFNNASNEEEAEEEDGQISKESNKSSDSCVSSLHIKEENNEDMGDKVIRTDTARLNSLRSDKADRALSVSIRAELEKKKKIEAMRRKCKLPKCNSNKQNQSFVADSLDTATKDIQSAILGEAGVKFVAGYECDSCNSKKETPSQTFFIAAGEHKPYQFDYRRIFNLDNTFDEEKTIKKKFIHALGTAEVNTMPDEPITYDESVRTYVHKVWKEGVAAKNEELERLEEKKKLQQTEKKITTPVHYDLDYYDPDNKELMHKLLKDGLAYLAKDPKYVLASIPESAKLPFLREWIYERYGKVYTRKARYKSFQISLRVFRAMEKLANGVPNPNYKMLGSKQFVDYSCRNDLLKKAELIKKDYYNLLNDDTMNEARIFWFAMRPYLCSNGPPRDTYYAYMPARAMDITRFRVWKPVEYMDAKSEWWKRKTKEDKLINN